MASVDWPETLPQELLAKGFSLQPQNCVLRTAMDAGPKKARRRYTARTVLYSGSMILDSMELAVFETFFHATLADGVLRFNFTDPLSLETAEFRFAKDYSVSENGGLFEVSLSLERM